MLFVGSGSLLRHALVIANSNSINIDFVCLNRDDGLLQFCRRMNIPAVVAENVNAELLTRVSSSSDGVAISINNSAIITDRVLSSEIAFFNIHNGLVQKYRGIAEVCVLAAICRSEAEYGSTLHQLLPDQEVDAGPVLDQRSFQIEITENFESIFSKSITNYQEQLAQVLPLLPTLMNKPREYVHGPELFSYKDVPVLISSTPMERRILACAVGRYSGLLPKLSAQIRNLTI